LFENVSLWAVGRLLRRLPQWSEAAFHDILLRGALIRILNAAQQLFDTPENDSNEILTQVIGLTCRTDGGQDLV
jgi:hypothetical protein